MQIFNFVPGPAVLPTRVKKAASEAAVRQPVSILELSHRSKEFEEILNEATNRLRNLLNVPAEFHIQWFGGGANQQFAIVAMNYAARFSAGDGAVFEYVVTGTWSDRAYHEAKNLGLNVHLVHDGTKACRKIAPESEWNWYQDRSKVAYTYYCANETVNGVGFRSGCPELPTGSRPDHECGGLIGDWSSNLLTSEISNWNQHDLIYSCAQKNMGIAGMTVVIVRKSVYEKPKPADALMKLPVIFDYSTLAKHNSLYNTPPTFAIWVSNEYMKWMEDHASDLMDPSNGKATMLAAIEMESKGKSSVIYDVLDKSDFYKAIVDKISRSQVNVVFRVGDNDEELEKRFLEESTEAGLINLKGHRSVGGIRASFYNALPYDGALALASFMRRFEEKVQNER